MKKRLSIVLPTYNEKDSLAGFVKSVLLQAKKLKGYKVFIIISDSNSSDGTGEIAEKLAKKYKNIFYINVGPGLGTGLYYGHKFSLEKVKPHILMQLDADGQVLESVIPKLVAVIQRGKNLALGSRFIKGGHNKLSFSRRLFSRGSSFVCRFIMGPSDILEFTNSARAFTPELFKEINWRRLPWKERSFIMQPAFLNEAILAGAIYEEVPLVFKGRAAGYSKNKIVNYTYDIICYTVEARFRSWGLNWPIFKLSRKIRF